MNSEKQNYLIDNHSRQIDYLRISLTDRCNLRCSYCMPEEGIKYVPHESILTYEENYRLVKIFAEMGITKIRITGGEPFVRKGIMTFIETVSANNPNLSLHITTNGVLAHKYIKQLEGINIAGINLSLDTLDKEKFKTIARRDAFNSVYKTLQNILESKIKLKINCVVQNNVNDNEINSISTLAEDNPVEVRFIEEMPFNGYKKINNPFTAKMIFDKLKSSFNDMEEITQTTSTAKVFKVPGFKGTIGIIGGYSRTFCSTCNRIRITPKGMLKTCLYDNGVLNLRLLLRSGAGDKEIENEIRACVSKRFKDGFEAEKYSNKINDSSMATIGG